MEKLVLVHAKERDTVEMKVILLASETRAPHVGVNARLQLLLKISKSKKGHNYVKEIEDYLPYWYRFPF